MGTVACFDPALSGVQASAPPHTADGALYGRALGHPPQLCEEQQGPTGRPNGLPAPCRAARLTSLSVIWCSSRVLCSLGLSPTASSVSCRQRGQGGRLDTHSEQLEHVACAACTCTGMCLRWGAASHCICWATKGGEAGVCRQTHVPYSPSSAGRMPAAPGTECRTGPRKQRLGRMRLHARTSWSPSASRPPPCTEAPAHPPPTHPPGSSCPCSSPPWPPRCGWPQTGHGQRAGPAHHPLSP